MQFPSSYASINPSFTAGKISGFGNCHAAWRHHKTTFCTSLVWFYVYDLTAIWLLLYTTGTSKQIFIFCAFFFQVCAGREKECSRCWTTSAPFSLKRSAPTLSVLWCPRASVWSTTPSTWAPSCRTSGRSCRWGSAALPPTSRRVSRTIISSCWTLSCHIFILFGVQDWYFVKTSYFIALFSFFFCFSSVIYFFFFSLLVLQPQGLQICCGSLVPLRTTSIVSNVSRAILVTVNQNM